jgi:adenosylcobinamide hydrolase
VHGFLPSHERRRESGRDLPMLVWRLPRPVRAIASGPFGGGIGPCHWVINATVDKAYSRRDPDAHAAELARGLDLRGPGVGLITAVDVGSATTATDNGVTVTATVGLGHPTWAAAPDGDLRAGVGMTGTINTGTINTGTINTGTINTGTINVVAFLPVALAESALVNAVITATEAKAQALWEYGVQATGTATDALFVGCEPGAAALEPYAGPRSVWGARLARAVHSAVGDGTAQWLRQYAG